MNRISCTVCAAMTALIMSACTYRAAPQGMTQIDPRLSRHPYCYDSLSKREKMLYDTAVTALMHHEESVSLPDTYTYDEVYKVYQLIYTDEYRLFCISPKFGFTNGGSLNLAYTCTAEEQDAMQKRMDAAAGQILSLTGGKTDYETVRIIHDEIIRRCTYTGGDHCNTAYGCLAKGQAMCRGYTAAFEYLCAEAGIDTIPVTDEDGAHIWALVRLDGDLYHVDATWDDPDDAERPQYVKYDYFCMSGTDMAQHRKVSPDVPFAAGERYDYFRINSLEADSIGEAISIIQHTAPDSGGAVQFRTSDREVFDSITHEFFDNGTVRDILPAGGDTDVYYVCDTDTLVIRIFP